MSTTGEKITIEQFLKEGLNEDFLKLIENDLKQDSQLEFPTEKDQIESGLISILQLAQKRGLIYFNVKDIKARLEESMKLYRKSELAFSVVLFPPMRIFMTEEYYNSMCDWRDFTKQIRPHYKQLSVINNTIGKNYTETNLAFPNITTAYLDLLNGIIISAHTCEKVYEEKRKICSLYSNSSFDCNVYMPETKCSLKEDEEILLEGLNKIETHEKLLLKNIKSIAKF